jgi:ABC-type amino acid transport substrate-binding protein
MSERPRWVGDAVTLATIAALFGAVYLLPPDTSLAEVERTGALGVCLPPLYPPLVTGEPDAPGFDVEFVQAIAKRLGVKVVVSANAAMTRNFNPRTWNVTRAQCQMLAGGVVASDVTRSFLDTTPPHLETGWAMVATTIPARLDGMKVGVYTGLAGLDRIGLSRLLRAANAQVEIMPSAEALVEALRAGRVQAGVSEALMARQIAGTLGLQAAWMPAPLARYPIAFGLWKGDLTLKRRLAAVIEVLESEGLTRKLAARYKIVSITATVRME